MQTPTVFISYSHDSDGHREWVYQLACRLVENGVEVVLDQWDIQLGSNIIKFMEKGLTNSDRVLVVCTEKYNKKSNEGLGGVGYEKNILTAELFSSQDTNKYIPCIRGVSSSFKTPVCLGGRAYIDFTDDATFDFNLNQLLHELFGIPLKPKPALGKRVHSLLRMTVPYLRSAARAALYFSAIDSATRSREFAACIGFESRPTPSNACEFSFATHSCFANQSQSGGGEPATCTSTTSMF